MVIVFTSKGYLRNKNTYKTLHTELTTTNANILCMCVYVCVFVLVCICANVHWLIGSKKLEGKGLTVEIS